MKRINVFCLILMIIFLGACGPSDSERAIRKTKVDSSRLTLDLHRLQAFSRELQDLEKEMKHLRKTIKRKERGHYSSDEHDKIENILFRYLMCRESLWEIINFHRDYKDRFNKQDDQIKSFIIAFDAALHLAYYSSLVVAEFIDDKPAIDKLNEKYYRSEIPRDTYDKLFKSVTSIDNIEALKTAWALFSSEMSDHDTVLFKIAESEPEYRKAIDQISALYGDVDTRIEYILKKKSLLLPNVRNRLRHTMIMALAKKAKGKVGDNLYAVRGILFVNVSRLKSPMSANIIFSKKQIRRIKSMLEPGDVILTFSAGYMSNVFLPGKFKHGITYVGSPAQRTSIGLPKTNLSGVPESRREKMKTDLTVKKLSSGHDADLIEAVAEGVIFNSLEKITDQHIARICVLRPRLNKEELIHNLTTVFLLLGNIYDFKFDFTDGSCQCCTEVVYRALNTVGPVRFNLTKRMGVQTLAADDIIDYYLTAENRPFDFVLLAEEDTESKGHKAKILTGDEGRKRLAELMEVAQVVDP